MKIRNEKYLMGTQLVNFYRDGDSNKPTTGSTTKEEGQQESATAAASEGGTTSAAEQQPATKTMEVDAEVARQAMERLAANEPQEQQKHQFFEQIKDAAEKIDAEIDSVQVEEA
jgi:hypothetical protein